MITLPNSCTCSNLSVFPKNWQSKNAKVNKDWYIMYRFYAPRYPKPKQVSLTVNDAAKMKERERCINARMHEL